MLHAALDGSLNNVPMRMDENFGIEVPHEVAGVDAALLNPRETWADKDAYDKKAQHLVSQFIENFKTYEDHVDASVLAAAPKAR